MTDTARTDAVTAGVAPPLTLAPPPVLGAGAPSAGPLRDAPDATADVRIVIEPRRGWANLGLRELWGARELLYFMMWRDVKGRYRQTLLGPLWYVLGPLMRMVVFSLVFGQIAKLPSDGVPYPIFTYTALLPWELFAGIVHRSTYSLVGLMHVIAKVYFPRLVVPISTALSGLVDFAISMVILLGMAWAGGFSPGARVLALPLFVGVAMMLGLGVGLWLATLAVKYRDVSTFVSYGITFWMYVTPVAYAASVVPERWRALYELNPMFWVVEGFRWAILGKATPASPVTALTFALSGAVIVSGILVFRRSERSIVDVL